MPVGGDGAEYKEVFLNPIIAWRVKMVCQNKSGLEEWEQTEAQPIVCQPLGPTPQVILTPNGQVMDHGDAIWPTLDVFRGVLNEKIRTASLN